MKIEYINHEPQVDTQKAGIFVNGKQVGILEKLIDCYILELNYRSQVVNKNEAQYINDYIKNQITLNERYITDEQRHKQRGFKVIS